MVPTRIATILSLLLWLDMVLAGCMHLSMLGVVGLSCLGFIFSSTIYAVARAYMVRERMWHFGRNKFSSYSEFDRWVVKTPAHVIDYLISLPHDEWEVTDDLSIKIHPKK